MVGLWQTVEREHPQYCGQRGAQDCELKCNGDKRRPTMQRPAADVQGITHCHHPPLHAVTCDAAEDTASKGNDRKPCLAQAEGLAQSFNWQWRIGVDSHIS